MGVKIKFSICFVLTMFAMVNFKMSMSNLVNHQIFFSVSYKRTFWTIILFSNNIIYLSALLVIIITDVCSVVIIHDCPLTYLERKYLGSSFIKGFIKIIKKLGIHYRDIDAYEYQLEILGIAWTFVAFKILILILIKTFNIPYESHIVIY